MFGRELFCGRWGQGAQLIVPIPCPHLLVDACAYILQETLLLQREVEAQAATGAVGYGDSATMELHGMLHDGEAETCATHLA